MPKGEKKTSFSKQLLASLLLSFKAELTADQNMEKKFIYSPWSWKNNNKVSSSGFVLFIFVLSCFSPVTQGGFQVLRALWKRCFFHIPTFVHTWPVMKRGAQIVPMMYCLSAQTSNTLLYSTLVYLVFLQIFTKTSSKIWIREKNNSSKVNWRAK